MLSRYIREEGGACSVKCSHNIFCTCGKGDLYLDRYGEVGTLIRVGLHDIVKNSGDRLPINVDAETAYIFSNMPVPRSVQHFLLCPWADLSSVCQGLVLGLPLIYSSVTERGRRMD